MDKRLGAGQGTSSLSIALRADDEPFFPPSLKLLVSVFFSKAK